MNVIVTGGSRGIGRGIVDELAAEGCYNIGVIARSHTELKALQKTLHKKGCACYVEQCDIRNSDNVKAAFSALISDLGGVDVLINNAGAIIRNDIFSLSLDDWHAMQQTNVNGTFYAVRAVIPYMQKQRYGHIINISSISGRLPLAGGCGYAASKYAVTGFSESLFLEVRDYGIKVTTIFPGSVDTSFHKNDLREEDDTSWKITPADVGRCCHDVIDTSPNNCISRVEVRPLSRARQNRES